MRQDFFIRICLPIRLSFQKTPACPANMSFYIPSILAINGGATAFSHVNDSGFWLVGSLLEIDEKRTLKSWTVMETIIGVVGLVCALVISIFA